MIELDFANGVARALAPIAGVLGGLGCLGGPSEVPVRYCVRVVDEAGAPVEGITITRPLPREPLPQPFATSDSDGLACGDDAPAMVWAMGLAPSTGTVIPSATAPYPTLRVDAVCRRRVVVDWGERADEAAAQGVSARLLSPLGVAWSGGAVAGQDAGPVVLPCGDLAVDYSPKWSDWELLPPVVAGGTDDIHLRIGERSATSDAWVTVVDPDGNPYRDARLGGAKPEVPPNRWRRTPGSRACAKFSTPDHVPGPVCPPADGWTGETVVRLQLPPVRKVAVRCLDADGAEQACPIGSAGSCVGSAAEQGTCFGPWGTCWCPLTEAKAELVGYDPAAVYSGVVEPDTASALLKVGTAELGIASPTVGCDSTLWKVDGEDAQMLRLPSVCGSGRAAWSSLGAGAYVVIDDGLVFRFGPYSLAAGEKREVTAEPMAPGPSREVHSVGLGGAAHAVVRCGLVEADVPFMRPTVSLAVPEGCTALLCGRTAGCRLGDAGECALDIDLACADGVDLPTHQGGDRSAPGSEAR